MCGRGALPDRVKFYKECLPGDFEIIDDKRNSFLLNDLEELPESYIHYNAPPGSNIPIISNQSPKAVRLMKWHFETKLGGKVKSLSNCKLEQAEKSFFYYRDDLLERRCVVIFSGYYEWIQQDPTNKKTLKQPVFIRLKNSHILPLAGVYKKNEDGSFGCSIITRTPLSTVERVHHRMPFVLNPGSMLDYLSPRLDKDKKLVTDWLNHNLVDGQDLEFYPVGKVVGNSPELLNQTEPIFNIN